MQELISDVEQKVDQVAFSDRVVTKTARVYGTGFANFHFLTNFTIRFLGR